MQVKSELHGKVRVVYVEGRWTGGHDDDPLRDEFHKWMSAGERLFILDLSAVDLLNSIGLGSLVGYYSSTAREKGKVKLSGLSERHLRAAYVSRILDLFEEYENVEKALASFEGLGEA